MKLEVGMYVRTKDGELGKVISNEMIEFPKDYAKIEYLLIGNEITKASHNIIDLIEAGDYVNGKKVIKVNTDYIFDYSEEIKIIYFSEEDYIYSSFDIKTIVTKQQFESMQYEVK